MSVVRKERNEVEVRKVEREARRVASRSGEEVREREQNRWM